MLVFNVMNIKLKCLLWGLLGALPALPAGAGGKSDPGAAVFDPGRVAVIKFTMTDDAYTTMMASVNSGLNTDHAYVRADFQFDGQTVTNVAVRLKGNSSLSSAPAQPSLKVDFNRYVTNQAFDGLSKLNIHNDSTEKSHLADYLSYAAWRDFGVAAPRTGWAEVWINGKALGTYTTVEQVDQGFITRHFDYHRGDLYKPESPAGTLAWRGASITNYSNVNCKLQEDTDHTAFLNMVKVINDQPVSAFSQVLDLKGVLTYLAGNVALDNWDDYTQMSHNYYLYENSPGKFTFLPWDMNFSQGSVTNLYPPLGMGGGTDMGGNAGGGLNHTNLPGGGIVLTNFPGGGMGNTNAPGGGIVNTNFPGGGIVDTNVPGGGLVNTNQPGGGIVNTNIPGGGIVDTNVPGGNAGGGLIDTSAHPVTDKLLADATCQQIYLTILKSFLEGPGSKEALNARIDYAVNILSNRLTASAVATLRSNIASRVDGQRQNLTLALTNPPTPRLRINEIMASNTRTIADETGDFDDWIEIYNPNREAVDMSGMFVTDNAANSRKSQLPTNTVIAAKGYLLLWADEQQTQGPLHLNFKLSGKGETVALYDNDARANLLIDSRTFGAQTADVSEGLLPDGGWYWLPQGKPTPGAANDVTDTDQDGLPDAWESYFGLNPAAAGDALADADGDGVSNLAEFATGTNPRDAASVLKLAVTLVSSNVCSLSWSAETGKRYQVQVAVQGPDGPWQDLGLTSNTGPVTDVRATSTNTQRFYRLVRVE